MASTPAFRMPEVPIVLGVRAAGYRTALEDHRQVVHRRSGYVTQELVVRFREQ